MNLSVLDDKALNHLLNSIKEANDNRREGEPLLEFTLIVKAPDRARELIQIVTGTVPASFKYNPPGPPSRSRKSD